MNHKQFANWLEALCKAWKEKDPQAAANLCAETVEYHETPFGPILKTREEVKKIWAEVPLTQKDIEFSYTILAVTENLGIA